MQPSRYILSGCLAGVKVECIHLCRVEGNTVRWGSINSYTGPLILTFMQSSDRDLDHAVSYVAWKGLNCFYELFDFLHLKSGILYLFKSDNQSHFPHSNAI